MNVADMGAAIARRSDDNKAVSVRDLLAMALEDVERKEFKNPKRAIILIVDEPEGDPIVTHSYRCGLGTAEQIGYLELEKLAVIERWKNSAEG